MDIETASFIIEDNVLKAKKIHFPLSDKRLNEVLLQNLRNNPNFVGQIDSRTGETCSFEKLANDSIRCALWLKKQGIGPGDIVAISTHHNIAAWVPICATYFIGAILNPWFDEWTPEVSRHFAKITKPKMIFANEQSAKILKKVFEEENIKTKIIIFGKNAEFDSLDNIINEGNFEQVENFDCYRVEVNDDALLLFSSGSSGLPKGILLSYGGLFYNACKQYSHLMKNKKKISTFTSSLCWVTSQMNILRSLLYIHPIIIVNRPTPNEFYEFIQKYKIQWAFSSIAFVNNLLQSDVYVDKYDLSSLEEIVTGGSKIRPEIFKKINSVLPHVALLQAYGLTEAYGSITFQQKSESINYDSCGKLMCCTEIKVIDNNETILGPNQEGEIYVKQRFIMKSYFGDPEATKDAIDKDGWLYTGDLGFYDTDGNVFITDRIKELIKYRGHHISPQEIVNILLKHQEVKEAAVVPISHPVDNQHALAFVSTFKKPSEAIEDELFKMSSVLGEYKRLKKIVFLENLPLIRTSEKVDRIELKKMAKIYDIK